VIEMSEVLGNWPYKLKIQNLQPTALRADKIEGKRVKEQRITEFVDAACESKKI
jgi:hypothetical protein